jgi:hypothetical protein
MVKYHFITFGTDDFIKFAKQNEVSALYVGNFDTSKIYTIADIDSFYKQKNMHYFNSNRPSFYWVWKPYIILKHLLTMEEDDVLCYNDSKYLWLKDVRDFANDILKTNNIGVYSNKPNGNNHIEKMWSKYDANVLMNVPNTQNVANTSQVWAGFLLIKKNIETITFISEWLTYIQDFRICGDTKNLFGSNSPSFIENRHDQTVLSLLCKKWKIPFYTMDNTYMIDIRNPPINYKETCYF